MSKPKKPKVQPQAPVPELPPPPARTELETAELAEENRMRNRPRSGGRAATFLTQLGLTEGSSAVRFLGGSAAT